MSVWNGWQISHSEVKSMRPGICVVVYHFVHVYCTTGRVFQPQYAGMYFIFSVCFLASLLLAIQSAVRLSFVLPLDFL